jgi:enoyl-CoA hydratase/carnithine racemase
MACAVMEKKGPIALLRMQNGTTNAIGPQLVEDMHHLLQSAAGTYEALVITGNEKFFSIGLDLPKMIRWERSEMEAFWEKFDQLVLDMYSLPVPTVCAISGHATAGGTILALTGDFRFAAAGRKLLGLNEIRLGLPVPHLTDLMLRQLIGDRGATRLLYEGVLVPAESMQSIGLVDKVCALDEVETAACEYMTDLAARPQPAFSMIKQNRVAAVRWTFERQRTQQRKQLMDCWFLPQTQKRLAEAALKIEQPVADRKRRY